VLPDLLVNRSTTVERVADALRTALLSGEFPPGTALREVELAEHMRVSRGSVREALLRLSEEGLLRRSSFRGVEVKQLTADEIRDLFVVRKLIELAAVDAAAQAPPADLDVLVRAADAFAQAIASGSAPEQHRADLAVHAALVGFLGSPRLSRVHAELMSELQLALSAQYRGATSVPGHQLVDRHEQIIRLLRSGDAVGARRQLEQRLDLAQQRLLRGAVTGGNGVSSPETRIGTPS
jgi:DNA-binding GntR family transcriptional regulator